MSTIIDSKKKRNTNRRKQLEESFDWTDAAIEECSDSNVVGETKRNFKDLESIIERVQARKKEEEERLQKRSLIQKPTSVVEKFEKTFADLSLVINISETEQKSFEDNTDSGALNFKFSQYLDSNPEILTLTEASFPLYLYDDNVFDESMTVPSLPCNAVCLSQSDSPEVLLIDDFFIFIFVFSYFLVWLSFTQLYSRTCTTYYTLYYHNYARLVQY